MKFGLFVLPTQKCTYLWLIVRLVASKLWGNPQFCCTGTYTLKTINLNLQQVNNLPNFLNRVEALRTEHHQWGCYRAGGHSVSSNSLRSPGMHRACEPLPNATSLNAELLTASTVHLLPCFLEVTTSGLLHLGLCSALQRGLCVPRAHMCPEQN